MSESAEALPLDPTKLVVATLSDPGKTQTENQDAGVTLTNVSSERLLVVADGAGAQRGGETASKLCVETLARVFRDPHGGPDARLRRGLELANEEVYSHALSQPELKGMATTAVALLFSTADRGVWLAWVGDSRCYRLRAGVLEQLTKDHSLMAEWVEMGVIREEEVEKHPRRHELTRAIGTSPDVVVDVVRVDVQPGDRFLLCSDGIHAPVGERGLKAALTGHSPDEAVRALVDRANANGGPDNATAIAIDVPREAFHAGAADPVPEVALELELPTLPPAPAPVSEPAQVTAEPPPEPPKSEVFGLDIEPTSHSPAMDDAIAELNASRIAVEKDAAGEDSGSSIPQMFELPDSVSQPELTPPSLPPLPEPALVAAEPPPPLPKPEPEPEPEFAAPLTPSEPAAAPEPAPARAAAEPALDFANEMSFADLLDESPGELTEPDPLERPAASDSPPPRPAARAATPPRPAPALTAPEPAASPFDSPSLSTPPPSAPIRIPLMTPVKRRRGLHAGSLLAGLAAGAVIAAVGAGAWLYLGASHSSDAPAPAPQRTAAARPTPAPEVAPTPPPAPAPTPQAAVTPPPTPTPAPAPAPAVTPPEPAPTQPPPAPIAMPNPPTRPQPTTVVIVRPPSQPPPQAVPAAPDGSAVTRPVPTSAGFELTPPVRTFVDAWLRALETHDSQLFTSLGFRELPTELMGTWTTRDGYRLVAATVDEERSTPDHVYLRLVVSYAFRNDTGRFRTEDEERMILKSQGSALRFEGRWQK